MLVLGLVLGLVTGLGLEPSIALRRLSMRQPIRHVIPWIRRIQRMNRYKNV